MAVSNVQVFMFSLVVHNFFQIVIQNGSFCWTADETKRIHVHLMHAVIIGAIGMNTNHRYYRPYPPHLVWFEVSCTCNSEEWH